MVTEKQGNAAPGQKEGEAPPAQPPQTPKFEMKDGAMLVDGHKVTYEKDLIAAKESLQRQAEQAAAAHSEAIDKARLELSSSQTEIAKANAKIQEMEQARKAGAASPDDPEEVARLKQEAEAAKSSAESATGQVLEYRKKLISATYPSVTAEQLEGKTPEQLDAFEEALKALSQSRGGPGPYAIPGGLGGATPLAPIDRAKGVLAATPYRGTRNADQK